MDASLLKQETFVKGEMVCILQTVKCTNYCIHQLLYSSMVFSKFFSSAGRGVDLNRNWGVDWGKKEKVKFFSILLFSEKLIQISDTCTNLHPSSFYIVNHLCNLYNQSSAIYSFYQLSRTMYHHLKKNNSLFFF